MSKKLGVERYSQDINYKEEIKASDKDYWKTFNTFLCKTDNIIVSVNKLLASLLISLLLVSTMILIFQSKVLEFLSNIRRSVFGFLTEIIKTTNEIKNYHSLFGFLAILSIIATPLCLKTRMWVKLKETFKNHINTILNKEE